MTNKGLLQVKRQDLEGMSNDAIGKFIGEVSHTFVNTEFEQQAKLIVAMCYDVRQARYGF